MELSEIFRVFAWKVMEKMKKKLIFFHLKNIITFDQFTQFWPFLAKLQAKIKLKICRKQIFHFLTFSGFIGIFCPKILKNLEFGIFWLAKIPKISKSQKSVSYRFFVSILPITWPKLAKIELSGKKL